MASLVQDPTSQSSRQPHPLGIVPSLLEVRALSSGYGRSGPVFHGLNFSVQRDEIVCILGGSGCGKSTLLAAIAGLRPADSGSVLLGGQPHLRPSPEIGFLFQQPALLPWKRVRDNIALALSLKNGPRLDRKHRREAADRELRSVGLPDAGSLWPSQLSGGMAQRVAFARTLARQPSLLLLDEPFSALDAITRLEMQKLLLEVVSRRKLSVLLVTHDLDEALLLGSRIILLGRRPATIVREWKISQPRPRFESIEHLFPLRCEILAALSRSLSSEPSVPEPYEI